MVCVLETTNPARRRRFGGAWKKWCALCEYPQHLRLQVETPADDERAGKKRVGRALREAVRRGADRVVLPKNFPFTELPEQYGLAVCRSLPLLRRLAGVMCVFAVDRAHIPWECVKLTLWANGAVPEMLDTACFLASYVRTLNIQAGSDTQAVCYALRSRCGISAAGGALRAGSGGQHIHILFESPKHILKLSPEAFLINLSGGNPAVCGGLAEANGAALNPPRFLWSQWPCGCDDAALLGALLEAGHLDISDITVCELLCNDKPVYF